MVLLQPSFLCPARNLFISAPRSASSRRSWKEQDCKIAEVVVGARCAPGAPKLISWLSNFCDVIFSQWLLKFSVCFGSTSTLKSCLYARVHPLFCCGKDPS